MPFRWCSNKYMCFFCCCPFDGFYKLKTHTSIEHDNPKLETVLNLVKYSRIKLDITSLSCKKCTKEIVNLEEFLDHYKSVHDQSLNIECSKNIFCFKLSDDDMDCLDCGQTFKFFGSLLTHVHKYHNKSNTYICEVCGQGFVGRANVISHIRNVHEKSKCLECNKTFPSNYAFTTHLEKVHRSEKLRCPKCSLILDSKYLKKKHLALVHDVKSNQYKCDECPKIFTIKNKLVQHKSRIHLREKSVTCEICGFKVFNKELLKRHMVRHYDARPYECDICKKCFQRKKTLEFHRRIHTNDRRYACKECGKAFVQATSLKLHVRVHHTNNESSWT